MAGGVGFEPTKPCESSGFQGRRIQPLCQPPKTIIKLWLLDMDSNHERRCQRPIFCQIKLSKNKKWCPKTESNRHD